jgi:hypothetical protein
MDCKDNAGKELVLSACKLAKDIPTHVFRSLVVAIPRSVAAHEINSPLRPIYIRFGHDLIGAAIMKSYIRYHRGADKFHVTGVL